MAGQVVAIGQSGQLVLAGVARTVPKKAAVPEATTASAKLQLPVVQAAVLLGVVLVLTVLQTGCWASAAAASVRLDQPLGSTKPVEQIGFAGSELSRVPRQSLMVMLVTSVLPVLQTLTASVTCTWRALFADSRHDSHFLVRVSPVVTGGEQLEGSPQSAVAGPTFRGVPLEDEEAVAFTLFRSPVPKMAVVLKLPVYVMELPDRMPLLESGTVSTKHPSPVPTPPQFALGTNEPDGRVSATAAL